MTSIHTYPEIAAAGLSLDPGSRCPRCGERRRIRADDIEGLPVYACPGGCRAEGAAADPGGGGDATPGDAGRPTP